MINTIAYILRDNILVGTFVLGNYLVLEAHSSFLGAVNVREQISVLFAPNSGYC